MCRIMLFPITLFGFYLFIYSLYIFHPVVLGAVPIYL